MYKTSYTVILSPEKVYTASLALDSLPQNDQSCIFSIIVSAPNAFRMALSKDNTQDYKLVPSGYIEDSITRPLSEIKQYTLYIKSDVMMSCQITLTFDQQSIPEPTEPDSNKGKYTAIGITIAVCLLAVIGFVVVAYISLK